jgi:hypothetical protein
MFATAAAGYRKPPLTSLRHLHHNSVYLRLALPRLPVAGAVELLPDASPPGQGKVVDGSKVLALNLDHEAREP